MGDTSPSVPRSVKRDPGHNHYVIALANALGNAARPQNEGGAVVELGQGESPAWLVLASAIHSPTVWELHRRHDGEWQLVFEFEDSLDAAAHKMRRFDEQHPIAYESLPVWPTES